MGIAKEIDGKEWTTTQGDTKAAYHRGMEEFQKPNPNYEFASVNQLYRLVFSGEYGTDMRGKLDNEMLGLKEMTGEEVKEVIRGCMSA